MVSGSDPGHTNPHQVQSPQIPDIRSPCLIMITPPPPPSPESPSLVVTGPSLCSVPPTAARSPILLSRVFPARSPVQEILSPRRILLDFVLFQLIANSSNCSFWYNIAKSSRRLYFFVRFDSSLFWSYRIYVSLSILQILPVVESVVGEFEGVVSKHRVRVAGGRPGPRVAVVLTRAPASKWRGQAWADQH